MHAILYTRAGCHLCDHAREVLETHGLAVESIDIDSDPELLARYDHCIPVVEIDGKERFRGRVEPVLLKRLLKSIPTIDTQLGVFAKYWEPGRVKTRLAADLGEDAAADLYRVFVETTLARFRGAADRCVLCFDPPERAGAFADVLPSGWDREPQSQGDLGERMANYFKLAFARGAKRVVLVGSDSPNVPIGCIKQAFDALDNSRTQVVLGPSGDGGYYLVATKNEIPPIFSEIDWSTDRVWQQTVDHLATAGLRHKAGYVAVPAWYDVDTIDDLRELRDQLLRQKDQRAEPPLARLFDAIERALLF